MRWFRWFLRNHRTVAPFGVCAHCDAELAACESCEGAWRGRNCRCGLGLRCPAHGRYWN